MEYISYKEGILVDTRLVGVLKPLYLKAADLVGAALTDRGFVDQEGNLQHGLTEAGLEVLGEKLAESIAIALSRADMAAIPPTASIEIITLVDQMRSAFEPVAVSRRQGRLRVQFGPDSIVSRITTPLAPRELPRRNIANITLPKNLPRIKPGGMIDDFGRVQGWENLARDRMIVPPARA